jgi:hypothetical protein
MSRRLSKLPFMAANTTTNATMLATSHRSAVGDTNASILRSAKSTKGAKRRRTQVEAAPDPEVDKEILEMFEGNLLNVIFICIFPNCNFYAQISKERVGMFLEYPTFSILIIRNPDHFLGMGAFYPVI